MPDGFGVRHPWGVRHITVDGELRDFLEEDTWPTRDAAEEEVKEVLRVLASAGAFVVVDPDTHTYADEDGRLWRVEAVRHEDERDL